MGLPIEKSMILVPALNKPVEYSEINKYENAFCSDVPIFMVTAPTEAGRGEHRPGSQQTTLTVSATATGDEPAPLMPAYSLAPVNSASSEWAEDIQLNWTKTFCRDDLQGCRDFLKEGMKICVMEEKVGELFLDNFQNLRVPIVYKESKQNYSHREKYEKWSKHREFVHLATRFPDSKDQNITFV